MHLDVEVRMKSPEGRKYPVDGNELITLDIHTNRVDCPQAKMVHYTVQRQRLNRMRADIRAVVTR